MFGHVLVGFRSSNFYFPHNDFIIGWIYSFHMPFMFVIAGYSHGIKKRFQTGERYSDYLRKYIIDIYIPCLYFSFAYWLTRIVFVSPSNVSTEHFHYASPSELLRIPFFGYNVYWFMCSLFYVKILHLLTERYIRRESLLFAFWILAFIIINSFGKFLPSFFRHFIYGLYFHAGFMLRRENYITQERHPNILWGIVLLLAGTFCFCSSHFYGTRNIFTNTGASLCTSLGFFVIFYALKINNSFLVACGFYSMVIYVLHSYIATPLRAMYRLTGLFPSGNPFMLSALSFIFSMLLPFIVVWLYKNVKCLRWIEYIFYPGRYKKNPLP